MPKPHKKPTPVDPADLVDQLVARMAEERSTPEGRKKMDPRLLEWAEERQLDAGVKQAAAMDILAVCEKHFPADRGNLDAPEMLAEAIDYFQLGDEPKNGCPLYLEWTVEAFVGQKLLENLDDILAVHDILVKYNCDENQHRQYEWNDGDNRLFYLLTDDETKKVWCSTSQNMRYMFIMDWNPELGVTAIHVRRYWDTVKPPADKWDEKDRAEYHEKGFELAVKSADWNRQYWSDNLLGNQYVDRPDLQWWKDHKFDPRYGDCRDSGYVMSMRPRSYERARVDRAIFVMSDIKTAFFEIRCAIDTLTNDPPVAPKVAPDEPEIVSEIAPEIAPEIGSKVVWDDDGDLCYGEIEAIKPGVGNCATHHGNLYTCRFSFNAISAEEFEEFEGDTYTHNFDDLHLGKELKILT